MKTECVIIPAYNEEATIGPVVSQFLNNQHVRYVIVAVDPYTTDNTYRNAGDYDRLLVHRMPHHGKGQCILAALALVPARFHDEVVLCDADVTISADAVGTLMQPLDSRFGGRFGQCIVVPREPTEKEWRKASTAAGVQLDSRAWPWVSGIRRVRTRLIPETLYGYLTETLINKSVRESVSSDTCFVYDDSTRSPLRFTPERVADLHEHGQYGKEKGLI